jgi:hypothetical protein
MPGFTQSLGLIGHLWRMEFTQCATSSLRFETASNNLIGLLTVGNVIGTGVTVTDYVIEWRLGSTTGTIVLISGHGSDSDIQALHPLVSEPVVGGELFAVIRYIVIDGVKYSPYFMQGQYSPDLIECLGSVTVTTMNCSNGIAGSYSHAITYSHISDPANSAERTLRFDLASDGSTSYLAWYFVPNIVADRITISYIHIGDEENPVIVDDWIVGYNTTSDFVSSPKKFKSQVLKRMTDLTGETFTNGDYLLIHITPRVEEPTNTNTDWQLYLACINSSECSPIVAPSGTTVLDPTTVTMTWNSTTCYWNLVWKNNAWYVGPDIYPGYSQNQYWAFYYDGNGNIYIDAQTQSFGVSFPRYTNGGFYYDQYSSICENLVGNMNAVKTGANLVITWDNITDYNSYKDSYNYALAQTYCTDYSADTTSYLHYKFWDIPIRVAAMCGDTYVDKSVLFHFTSTIVWDDVNMTLTVDMVNVTNGLADPPCDGRHQQTDVAIAWCARIIAGEDYNVTTQIGMGQRIWVDSIHYTPQTSSSLKLLLAYAVPDAALLGGCLPEDWQDYGSYYGFRLLMVTASITDEADPAGNFRIENWLNTDGTIKLVSEIVYEMAGGVQIIP